MQTNTKSAAAATEPAVVGEIDLKPVLGSRSSASSGGVGGAAAAGTEGVVASKSVPARRLGRGLSALIGSPMPVDAGVRPETLHAQPTNAAHPAPTLNPRPTAARAIAPAPTPTPKTPTPASTQAVAARADAPRGEAVREEAREDRETDARERVLSLELDSIVPSPHQPRKVFETSAIDELAASIRAAGVIQPIVVRVRASSGGAERSERTRGHVAGGASSATYELIAGERRWRAARAAGLARIPAILATISDEQAAEWALIENLQRTDLSAMERADALKSLSEKFSLTHAELARRVGLDRSSVTNLIRLTELEDSLRTLLQEGRLSLGHGKALLMMKPGAAREKLGQRAEREGWSVRKLEQAAAGIKQRGDEDSLMLASTGHAGQGTGAGAALGGASGGGVTGDSETMNLRARDAALRDLERQLGEHLGTKVRVRTDKSRKRGSLVVSFYDLDQFDGLMSKMGFALK